MHVDHDVSSSRRCFLPTNHHLFVGACIVLARCRCQSPYFVATELSGIRKASLTAPKARLVNSTAKARFNTRAFRPSVHQCVNPTSSLSAVHFHVYSCSVYGAAAVADIGSGDSTVPYWPHGLQVGWGDGLDHG